MGLKESKDLVENANEEFEAGLREWQRTSLGGRYLWWLFAAALVAMIAFLPFR